MPKDKDLLIVLGTGLFNLEHLADRNFDVLMVEDQTLCRRMRFHKQKLAFLLAAMRNHRDALTREGHTVHYFDLNTGISLTDAIDATVARVKPSKLRYFETDETASAKAIEAAIQRLALKADMLPSPMFLMPTAELDCFFANNPADLERFSAQRLHALDVGRTISAQDGAGAALRESAIPRNAHLPKPHCVVHTANASEVIDLVDTRFPRYPGRSEGLWLPTTRAGALDWLERFLEQRLIGFESYGDAITKRSRTVHHSMLSPLLNVGLITPSEVIDRTLAFARRCAVPKADLHSFLDQIIGRREFIRGVYRRYGTSMRRRNAWDANRKLGKAWVNADTGIPPLDHALQGSIDWAWNHHTERLTVIANMMNLAEIAPNDVYRFFMSHYIDAYDWVMVPNVYGMGLQSEGGIFQSRLNLCRSEDLLRVSDFEPGPWCDVVDGLYWRFVYKHQEALAANPAMAPIVEEAQQLPSERKQSLLCAADGFLAAHTR